MNGTITDILLDKTDFLHGVARYVAEILNTYNAKDGNLKKIHDEVLINTSADDDVTLPKQMSWPYYDSVELRCDRFRYFLTFSHEKYVRFTIVRRGLCNTDQASVQILADMDICSSDFQRHDSFSESVILNFRAAVLAYDNGDGTPSDEFSPLD